MFSKKKKESELLSVIIPSYNHEKYISEAIKSVLNQTYSNLELIVIDDGSKDNSVEIIKAFHDDRIKLVCQKNQGAHNAINNGLKMASGNYIAILNSDDIYEENRFEIMINEMHRNPQVGFLCSYIQIIDSEGNNLAIKEGWKNMEPWNVPHPEVSYQVTEDFKLNLIMSNFTSTTSNFLFKKEIYDKIGGMRNLHFAHDWDFALRAAEITECKIVEEPLMKYRVHQTNTISTNRKWMLFEVAWMWATNIERFYDGTVFWSGNDEADLVHLVESINLQGNDKVFWIIKTFIEAKKKQGIKNPEEILLDNDQLRNRIIEYVVE